MATKSWTSRTQKALRKRLIKALRSNEYTQVEGCLEAINNDGTIAGNCVMGVACRVLVQFAIDNEIEFELRVTHKPSHGYPILFGLVSELNGRTKILPDNVRIAYGFTTQEGHFDEPIDQYTSLLDMNDSGLSFEKIAQILEEEPEGLFTDDANSKKPKRGKE